MHDPQHCLHAIPCAVVLSDSRPPRRRIACSRFFTVVLADARVMQRLDPPHCLHSLLLRLCSQILVPPHLWLLT
jgi:hypothetical protein